jgi:hypothetical protein
MRRTGNGEIEDRGSRIEDRPRVDRGSRIGDRETRNEKREAGNVVRGSMIGHRSEPPVTSLQPLASSLAAMPRLLASSLQPTASSPTTRNARSFSHG